MQEAISKASIAWAPLAIPVAIQAVLDDPAVNVDKSSSMFWLMVAALKRFVVCFSVPRPDICDVLSA
jgi:hypothetical protein